MPVTSQIPAQSDINPIYQKSLKLLILDAIVLFVQGGGKWDRWFAESGKLHYLKILNAIKVGGLTNRAEKRLKTNRLNRRSAGIAGMGAWFILQGIPADR